MILTISNAARALAAAAVAATLVACGPRDDRVAADSAMRADTTTLTTSAGMVDRDMSDAGIVGLLQAANRGEVEAADVALQKTRNARVREFAQKMKQEHGTMLSQTEQLGQSLALTPVVPRDEDDLVKEHRENMEELTKDDENFDEEYMEGQIEEHQETLDLIDKALENAQSPQLRQLLQEARPKVDQHLTLAKQIKDEID